MALIDEVRQELSEITDFGYTLSILSSGSVLVTLSSSSANESRWIMQAFNTPKFRSQRRDRSFQEIEVKYRAH